MTHQIHKRTEARAFIRFQLINFVFITDTTTHNTHPANMKTSAAIILASVCSASAFMVPTVSQQSSTSLYATATKGKVSKVKTSISNITIDSFSSTLTEIEPFLTKDAGNSIYKKSMQRINAKAKMLGVEVPAGYAKEAKCTEKRREKQDSYCKAKAEEAAAAAEEEAPAEEETVSEEAPAEE